MATKTLPDLDTLRTRAASLGYFLLDDESDEKAPYKLASQTEVVCIGSLSDIEDWIEATEQEHKPTAAGTASRRLGYRRRQGIGHGIG